MNLFFLSNYQQYNIIIYLFLIELKKNVTRKLKILTNSPQFKKKLVAINAHENSFLIKFIFD